MAHWDNPHPEHAKRRSCVGAAQSQVPLKRIGFATWKDRLWRKRAPWSFKHLRLGAALMILAHSSACSLRWQARGGELRDFGAVFSSTTELKYGKVRTYDAPGISLRLGGPDVGLSIGWWHFKEWLPEVRIMRSMSALNEDVLRFIKNLPQSNAPNYEISTFPGFIETASFGFGFHLLEAGSSLALGYAAYSWPSGLHMDKNLVLGKLERKSDSSPLGSVIWILDPSPKPESPSPNL